MQKFIYFTIGYAKGCRLSREDEEKMLVRDIEDLDESIREYPPIEHLEQEYLVLKSGKRIKRWGRWLLFSWRWKRKWRRRKLMSLVNFYLQVQIYFVTNINKWHRILALKVLTYMYHNYIFGKDILFIRNKLCFRTIVVYIDLFWWTKFLTSGKIKIQISL